MCRDARSCVELCAVAFMASSHYMYGRLAELLCAMKFLIICHHLVIAACILHNTRLMRCTPFSEEAFPTISENTFSHINYIEL